MAGTGTLQMINSIPKFDGTDYAEWSRSFNDILQISWTRSMIGGGGDVTILSPFWEGTVRKLPLPGTYLTNLLVK